jgi:hypothetical protein
MAYRNGGTEEEPDNYWNSGQSGNKEEYEEYLLIKSRLEGKKYRPPHENKHKKGRGQDSLLSFYPGLKGVVVLLFFIYVSHLLQTYLKWGLTGRFFGGVLYWGTVLSVTYWYFIKRNPGKGSVATLDQIFPNASIPNSLPYWAFLLGCLFASLDLNDLKVWVRGVEHLSLAIGKPVECDVLLSLNLPRMPLLLKLAASLSILLSGGLLLFDAIAHRIAE